MSNFVRERLARIALHLGHQFFVVAIAAFIPFAYAHVHRKGGSSTIRPGTLSTTSESPLLAAFGARSQRMLLLVRRS